jgi:diguanylate cyclase (GGDEF)-like protein
MTSDRTGPRQAFLGGLTTATAKATEERFALTLLLLDVDDFAVVSRRLGPARSNALLDGLVRRLAAAARAEDVVCRTGGDGLAAVLPAAERGEAEGLFARLQAGLQRDPPEDGPVGLSAGIATARADERPVELLARATAALRAAKRAGKGTAKAAP